MTPPLIVAEGLDVAMFEDARLAERYLESYDVEDDVYESWHASGRCLRLEVNRGRVEVSATDRFDREGLMQRLRKYLDAVGSPVGGDASLDSLVNLAWSWAETR